MVIHKFPLLVQRQQSIDIDNCAQHLTVQLQDGVPALWSMVEPSRTKRSRAVYMFGTGHEMGDASGLIHIGTVQMDNGLVFHYFMDYSA